MYNNLFSHMGNMWSKFCVVDFKIGDVTGDRIPDRIFLIGEKPFGPASPFVDNITLVIQNSINNICTRIPLKVNAGYNPTIFLGDFTKDNVKDILVSIDSGGSGGFGFYYIYSFLNNKPKKLFDFETFNKLYEYDVIYKDYYKVDVINKITKKRYIIDISYKDPIYLKEIYDENGKLIKPINGYVIPLGGLYPVDFNRDGSYELFAIQRIIGKFNADTLGYVQTILRWNGNKFAVRDQYVSILGSDANGDE